MSIKTNLEVEINPDWINFLMEYPDIFGRNYCGYWMYGMELDEKLGWLCYIHDEEKSISQVSSHPKYKSIVEMWRSGKPLPDRWVRLNERVAIQAYLEGVKRKGIDWYSIADAEDYDVVLQKAIFGVVIYG